MSKCKQFFLAYKKRKASPGKGKGGGTSRKTVKQMCLIEVGDLSKLSKLTIYTPSYVQLMVVREGKGLAQRRKPYDDGKNKLKRKADRCVATDAGYISVDYVSRKKRQLCFGAEQIISEEATHQLMYLRPTSRQRTTTLIRGKSPSGSGPRKRMYVAFLASISKLRRLRRRFFCLSVW